MADGEAREREIAGEQAPISETVQKAIENVQEIVRSEVRRAGAEMREKAVEAGKAGAGLGAGAVISLFGTAFLLVSAHKLLSRVVPSWVSALAIGAALQGTSAALILGGVNNIRKLTPVPERAIGAAKETIEEIRQHAG